MALQSHRELCGLSPVLCRYFQPRGDAAVSSEAPCVSQVESARQEGGWEQPRHRKGLKEPGVGATPGLLCWLHWAVTGSGCGLMGAETSGGVWFGSHTALSRLPRSREAEQGRVPLPMAAGSWPSWGRDGAVAREWKSVEVSIC